MRNTATKSFHRNERTASWLHRTLCGILQNQSRDPRLAQVQIVAVELNRDFSHARVFISPPSDGGKEAVSELLDVCNSAAGFLRSRLAGYRQLRTTPHLQFRCDPGAASGARVEQLLSSLNAPAAGAGEEG